MAIAAESSRRHETTILAMVGLSALPVPEILPDKRVFYDRRTAPDDSPAPAQETVAAARSAWVLGSAERTSSMAA